MQDVRPGNYTLNLAVTEPADFTKRDFENMNRKPLGKTSVPVTVPEGDVSQPVDLGALVIPVR